MIDRELIRKRHELLAEIEELERCREVYKDRPSSTHFELKKHYGTCRDSEKVILSERHTTTILKTIEGIISKLEEKLNGL